ncbi:MAG: chorismate synthase [Thermoplasmataceae archaeon]
MVSSMGRHLILTTFGESASRYVGAVVDGIPAGLPLSEEDLRFELGFRRTGRKLVSGRREDDVPEIVSGVYNGYTTGSPVTVTVRNSDAQPLLYKDVSHLPRPGHADLAFIKKYGRENWDYVGGGRSSARETLSRVIGGAIAKKLLMIAGTQVAAYLKSIGGTGDQSAASFTEAMESKHFATRARNSEMDAEFSKIINRLFSEGDSAGGIVEVIASGVIPGMGDPVFWKIKSELASAMMSMPAATGFEYGLGFKAASMRGSEASDSIIRDSSGNLRLEKNLSGGILGGITTGSDIVVRCAFKPTSSIRKPSITVDLDTMEPGSISVIGRHDPVVAVRGVSVAEAMMALVLADYYLYEGIIAASRISRKAAEEMEGKWKAYMKEYAQ